MYISKYAFKVRYAEVDRMNIVYHANYIVWFEIGRTEFLRELGYAYSQLEEEKIWLPVTEIGCKYKSPVTYDDTVTIETSIAELSRVRIKFNYKVYCENRLIVEGFSGHGITNDKLKPIGLHRIKPELYDKLETCMK